MGKNVTLVGREAIPLQRLSIVLRHTLTVVVHSACGQLAERRQLLGLDKAVLGGSQILQRRFHIVEQARILDRQRRLRTCRVKVSWSRISGRPGCPDGWRAMLELDLLKTGRIINAAYSDLDFFSLRPGSANRPLVQPVAATPRPFVPASLSLESFSPAARSADTPSRNPRNGVPQFSPELYTWSLVPGSE